MPIEHGFSFKITGEVFIARKSSSAADVSDAIDRAERARIAVAEALTEIPVTFAIGDAVARSRRVDGEA